MNKDIKQIVIRPEELEVYAPPGHDDTFNKLFLGPKNGCDHIEFILGEMGKQGSADPHFHADSNQILFMIEGKLKVTGNGVTEEVGPSDLIYWPAGCEHVVDVITEKAKFLVIYTPPRGGESIMDSVEDKSQKVIRPNDIEVYAPAAHDDTYNRLYIGPKNGCPQLEFIIGEMGKQGKADPHFHADTNQLLYMLEGEVEVVNNDDVENLVAGDLVYWPINCNHIVNVQTEKAKFIVLYTPPRKSYKIQSDDGDVLIEN